MLQVLLERDSEVFPEQDDNDQLLATDKTSTQVQHYYLNMRAEWSCPEAHNPNLILELDWAVPTLLWGGKFLMTSLHGFITGRDLNP